MRIFGKWLGRILLALVLAAGVISFWKREEITRLLAVNSLFSEEKIVNNFSHMDAAFPNTPISGGDGPVSELPEGQPMTLPADVAAWITDRNVTSLLVLKDGDIVFEDYYLGTGKDDRRISWSLAKSYLSALFAVLIDEGKIDSFDDPVAKYAPHLKGSDSGDTSIRNMLNMASGSAFDKGYPDCTSDNTPLGRVGKLDARSDEHGIDITIDRHHIIPGNNWQFMSFDSILIDQIMRGTTGHSIPDLLSEKIIGPLGQERDGFYITNENGAPFVLDGLNLTTRDYARFAQMILQDGEYNGQQIIPAGWITASIKPSASTTEDKTNCGSQWWNPDGSHEGKFQAQGVYGQYIYIDRPAGVVIVTTGADRHFRDPGVSNGNIAIFRQITESLQ